MATRSPSPNPSRPKTYNYKTPESANSLRKSKEIPPWNSFPKLTTSPRTSLDLNENQDPNFLKPVKLKKSHVISASKGSKNFMSPTISAASKAVPASPMKKILQERNEVITPVPDSLKLPLKEGGVGFGSQQVLGGCELKKRDSMSKNQQAVSIPTPYDPNNNYLSPRPMFPHYRPSPRIEHYLDREGELLDVGDGRQLEETELTEKDLSHVDDHVTQPALRSEPFRTHGSTRFRLAPLLLVIAMACLYAPLSDSPIISSSLLSQNQYLPKLYISSSGVFEGLQHGDYLSIVDVNLQGVATRFKRWSTYCINYFTCVASPTNIGLYHLVNMTSSGADETVGLDVCYVHETEPLPQVIMESEQEEIIASGVVIESDEGAIGTDFLYENTELVASKDEYEEINMGVSVDAEEAHFGARSFGLEISEEVMMGVNNVSYDMDKEIVEERPQNHDKKNEEINTEEEIANDDCTEALDELSVGPEVMVVREEDSSSDVVIVDHSRPQNSLDLKVVKLVDLMSVLGFFLPLVLLAATFPFLFPRKQKKTLTSTQKKERPTSKKVKSVSLGSEIYTTVKDSLNNEEIISEFGPSEVSSSWNNERRDSTASSSTSYGSFTTYEKLSVKKPYRDEEVVTPVRRSSRIRNLVTSP